MEIVFYYRLFEMYFFFHLKKEFEPFLTSNTFPFTRKDASDIDNYYDEDYVTQHDLLRGKNGLWK